MLRYLPSKDKGFTSTALIVVLILVVVVLGLLVVPSKDASLQDFLFGTDNVTQNSNTLNQPSAPQLPKTETSTADQFPNSAHYVNEDFGISFYYDAREQPGAPDPLNFATTVTVLGNRTYVHGVNDSPESGQFVEVYLKDPTLDIKSSIEREFLRDLDKDTLTPRYKDNCHVTRGASVISGRNEFYDRFELYSINPIQDTSEMSFEERLQIIELCPPIYTRTNGISYFLYDPAHPDKYAFFSIGQYSRFADYDRGITWEKTFEFTDSSESRR